MTVVVEPFGPRLRDINRRLTTGRAPSGFEPAADVVLSDDAVAVQMDVPGLDPADVDIELDGDVLTIRGERPNPYDGEGERRNGGSYRIERGFGRFERVLRVPKGLEADSIEASLQNGVLTLRIPRPEPSKPRRIEVKESSEAG